MKRLSLMMVLGMLCAFFMGTLSAQTARVQVIHNSPDPAAASVDIYVNGSVAVPGLGFREATPFVELPLDATVSVGVAGAGNPLPGTDIELDLTADEVYVIFAVGAVDTTVINTTVANDNGVSAAFQYAGFEGHDTLAVFDPNNVSLTVFHGAIDADSVDVLANGGVLVDDISFPGSTDNSGFVEVPAAEYVLQITPYNDNETIVLDAGFVADLTDLAGEGLVVFASGYADPAANNNGPAFGLFAVSRAGGPAIELPLVGDARAQVIHNSADLGAATVDIYVDLKTDTVKFDDVAFRDATPFVDLPTGYEIEIVIAGPSSTAIDDQVVATFPATLEDGMSLYIIADGILPGNEGDYDTMTNMGFTEFDLVTIAGAQESSLNAGDFDLLVYHGATDAPAVDIIVNQDFANPLITDFEYVTDDGYFQLAPAAYELGIGASTVGGADDIIATFAADLSGAADGAGIILASGFLTPEDDNNGPGFGLLFVTPNGDATLLSTVTSIRELTVNNQLISVYPNPVSGQATLSYQVQEAGAVTVELFDTQGRAVISRQMEQVPGEYDMSVETSGLSQGVHLMVVTTASTRSTARIMVK